jgi:hypothetical protein
MKQFIYLFFLAAVFAACSDNAETAGRESKTTVNQEPENDVASISTEPGANDVNVDTIGMAEFLALKAAAARHSQSNGLTSNDITDVNDINVDTLGFAAFKRQKAETARQSYEDSIRRAEIIAERKKYNTEGNTRTGTTKKSAAKKQSTDNTVSADETGVAEKPADTVKEKRGWSKKAKGAVIGAATGAAAGAVINKKNRKVGGVVGGVVGAAAGYGIGRHKDKKEEKKDTTVIEQQ